MSVLAWQRSIYERLKAGLPSTRVFLEGVPENSPVPHDHTGLIKPFAIVWFGQLTDSTTTDETDVDGLCDESGSIADTKKQGNLALATVAPSGLSLLQLEDAGRRLLTGFSPVGGGPLKEDGSTAVRDPLPIGLGDQIRFYKALFFSGEYTGGVGPPLLPPTRPAADRTHCPQGHLYDEANTIINNDGKRRCRTCVNARARARNAKADA